MWSVAFKRAVESKDITAIKQMQKEPDNLYSREFLAAIKENNGNKINILIQVGSSVMEQARALMQNNELTIDNEFSYQILKAIKADKYNAGLAMAQSPYFIFNKYTIRALIVLIHKPKCSWVQERIGMPADQLRLFKELMAQYEPNSKNSDSDIDRPTQFKIDKDTFSGTILMNAVVDPDEEHNSNNSEYLSILSKYADPNKGYEGNSALYRAIALENVLAIQTMLQSRKMKFIGTPNNANADNTRQVIFSTRGLVYKIINNFAHKPDIAQRLVEQLLKHHNDPNIPIDSEKSEQVQKLAEDFLAHYKPNTPDKPAPDLLEVASDFLNPEIALLIAIRMYQREIIQKLIQHGADFNKVVALKENNTLYIGSIKGYAAKFHPRISAIIQQCQQKQFDIQVEIAKALHAGDVEKAKILIKTCRPENNTVFFQVEFYNKTNWQRAIDAKYFDLAALMVDPNLSDETLATMTFKAVSEMAKEKDIDVTGLGWDLVDHVEAPDNSVTVDMFVNAYPNESKKIKNSRPEIEMDELPHQAGKKTSEAFEAFSKKK